MRFESKSKNGRGRPQSSLPKKRTHRSNRGASPSTCRCPRREGARPASGEARGRAAGEESDSSSEDGERERRERGRGDEYFVFFDISRRRVPARGSPRSGGPDGRPSERGKGCTATAPPPVLRRILPKRQEGEMPNEPSGGPPSLPRGRRLFRSRGRKKKLTSSSNVGNGVLG